MDGMQDSKSPSWAIPSVPRPLDLVGERGDTDGMWFSVGEVPTSVAQGWKIYISATIRNYVPTLIGVARIFVAENVPFKYLVCASRVRDQNSGIYGYSQVGKCIVAYIHSLEGLKGLLVSLKAFLDDLKHEGPFVPRLPRAWPGGSVFYRYGSYRSRELWLNGRSVPDDRLSPSSIIGQISSNPFLVALPGVGGPARACGASGPSILQRYPVVSPICRSGKGGVFRAFDPQENCRNTLVVKIGLKLGNLLPDGRDAAYFLQHEFDMYRSMRSAGLSDLLPAPVAFSKEAAANVLVLERIQGQNLAQWRAEGGYELSPLKAALSLIERVHDAGFSLGDAKTANFISAPNRVVLLDLESAQPLASQELMPSTFILGGVPGTGSKATDVLHFLISAVFRSTGPEARVTVQRTIDVPGFVASFVPRDIWDEYVLTLLRLALSRLPCDPSLTSVIAMARPPR